ncbi:MAG: VacB/RNase II family 3'-5' exoribonuclease [Phycisphaeraceae bacterium]|nr:VacB/RNase II family 3'-5' exoribonuclease [Phycisphaerales bacterium]MCB9860164.1 VacB/RNase II family 3'-5' exoribonuclease [Phycisphaeraceae bacterium]
MTNQDQSTGPATKPPANMLAYHQARVLRVLTRRDYEPMTVLDLEKELHATDDPTFEQSLRWLDLRKVIDIANDGRVRLASVQSRGGEMEGQFRRGPRGAGFFKPDEPVREGDIYIPAEETFDALPGDRVAVQLLRDKRRERKTGKPEYIGRVVEVIERKRTSVTGTIEVRGKTFLVIPDGKDFDSPVVVKDATSKNVKAGDKVVVELLVFPEGNALGEGVISKVLGEAGEPDVETQAVIAAFNLPGDFDEECMAQARTQTRRFNELIERFESEGADALPDRLDLTNDFICTIDPPDAKDYDDALSIKKIEGGGWEVGVHIADVSFFIDRDSPLDIEAIERGNSVYLPRLVIPMLPELLSNGICSLQERVLRFAKSAFIRYDASGKVMGEGVGQTLIKSAKRLTYLEAQALIDGDEEEAKKHARTEPNYTPELIECLKMLNTCSRAIRQRRIKQGMISLDLPDAELVFDEDGRVIDAHKEDDAYTHTLIEMFMVEANEALARLFESLDVPVIRRIHEAPQQSSGDEIRKVATVAGYKIPSDPTRQELQGLLDATKGTPAGRAVHMAVLRTLTRAEYRPVLVGHYALASNAYAHFTSPIRRYADLTLHRALAAYLDRTDNGTNRPPDDKQKRMLGRELLGDKRCPPLEDLAQIATHISGTEDNAESAERDLRKFLVLQFLETKIGEVFKGVVTGITPRGVFVQIDEYVVDGFVKTEDLPGDVTRDNKPPRWQLDKQTGSLIDANSGRSYSFGDSVDVSIAKIDLTRRELDLVVTNAEKRAAGKSKLTLGDGAGGGLASSGGGGFKDFGRTGAQKRSQRSKSRDKRKQDYRRDKKK